MEAFPPTPYTGSAVTAAALVDVIPAFAAAVVGALDDDAVLLHFLILFLRLPLLLLPLRPLLLFQLLLRQRMRFQKMFFCSCLFSGTSCWEEGGGVAGFDSHLTTFFHPSRLS